MMFRRSFLGAIFGGLFTPFWRFQKQDELKIVDSRGPHFKVSALYTVIGIYYRRNSSTLSVMLKDVDSGQKKSCVTTDKYYFTGLFEKRLGWRLAKDLKKGDNIFVPVNLVYQEKCL